MFTESQNGTERQTNKMSKTSGTQIRKLIFFCGHIIELGVGQRKKNVTGLTFVGKVGSLHFFSFTVKQFENTAIRLKSCLNNNPGKALFHS